MLAYCDAEGMSFIFAKTAEELNLPFVDFQLHRYLLRVQPGAYMSDTPFVLISPRVSASTPVFPRD